MHQIFTTKKYLQIILKNMPALEKEQMSQQKIL